MQTSLEKALAMLAQMRGTSIEAQVERFNAEIIAARALMKVPPALTDEEREARVKASKQKSLAKAKQKRAAARALRPGPSAEELAAKAAERKARERAYAREYMAMLRAKRRAERAFRKTYGLGALPLRTPTIAEAQSRISKALAPATRPGPKAELPILPDRSRPAGSAKLAQNGPLFGQIVPYR